MTRLFFQALSEMEAAEVNGDNPADYVNLHNKYPREVQEQLRFVAQIRILRELKEMAKKYRREQSMVRKIRSDLTGMSFMVAFIGGLAVFAVLVAKDVDVTGAIAAGFGSAWIAYFAEYALSALVFHRQRSNGDDGDGKN